MRVTIIADASYCPETRAAGYAFWIASGRGKRGGHGAIKDRVVNNIAAEMMALLNGLHQACVFGLVQPQDEVLLQTDCLAAIAAFENNRKSITKEELELVQYFLKLKSRASVSVVFRHVKGHTRGGEPRLWVSNKCDELAGAGMRQARHLFRQQRNLK